MTINWYEIFGAIITLLCAVVTRFIIPWIKEKVEASKYKNVMEKIMDAVYGVEEIYRKSGMGEVKKKEVINYISLYLMKKHIYLSDEEIELLIHSAVCQLHLEEKEVD